MLKPDSLRADDAYKAGVYIVDGVKLTSEKKCPFELEHGMTIWDWFGTPESALARDRTNKAMVGAEGFLHGSLIYDYDWEKHGQGVTIVDVGGGVGGAAIELCRRFPKIKIVLQDRPSVIEAAPKVRNINPHHPFGVYTYSAPPFLSLMRLPSSLLIVSTEVLGRKCARVPAQGHIHAS